MAFLAIVHSPELRLGARLCISDLAQTTERAPKPLSPGAPIDLRFGTCSPDLRSGSIGLCDISVEEAVLRVADADWHIRRSHQGGVCAPGLVADDWFVVEGLSAS